MRIMLPGEFATGARVTDDQELTGIYWISTVPYLPPRINLNISIVTLALALALVLARI